VEYVDFQDVLEHREFRFRAYGRAGCREFRIRVANAALDSRRIGRQDCPDLCYQVLVRAVRADVAAIPELVIISDADLVGYREAHTPVPRRRARPATVPGGEDPKPAAPPRKAWQYRAPPRKAPAEAPAPMVPTEAAPVFGEGQRVSHSVFGLGVTKATSGEHTIVSFDEGGVRSFVTSMLKLECLSAPGSWEISRRGGNRPCGPCVE